MWVKKQHLEMGMEQLTDSKLVKECKKACLLSLCLFNLYAEYIIWKAGLDKSQTGIKIIVRNINHFRWYHSKAESEEELKSLDDGERGKLKSWINL